MTAAGRHAARPGRPGSRPGPGSSAYLWPEPPREDLSAAPWTEHVWVDADAGPVVRPYAMTGGRVVPAAGGFDLIALVVTNRAAAPGAGHELQPEHRAILVYAREPLAVAEVAARLDLPLGVVRVLLGDLLGAGLIEVVEPEPARDRSDPWVLRAVADGLRAL